MGWETLGTIFLAPQRTGTYFVTLNDGADMGTQFMIADPETPGVPLVSGFISKERTVDGITKYWLSVGNNSQFAVLFKITGGGVT